MPAKSKRLAPTQVASTTDLANLQRAMWRVVSRPLTDDSRMQEQWTDGRPTAEVAAEIAKPNDRLTSFERLEIYNRMYWFRVLDSLYEDCPGLRAVLGDNRFIALAEAYLVKYPSRSFTLRNLPSHLARFIQEAPPLTAPYTALCRDLARFEWARVEVFDTAAQPVFSMDDLLDVPATKQGRLKLALQPYLQLLELDYPVDDFILAVKKQREPELLRGDASNAPTELRRRKARKTRLPSRARTHVAIHRLDGQIYFKRLEPAAYRILVALRSGKTLEQAIAGGLRGARKPTRDPAAQVQAWFKNWMELRWLCRR